MSLATPLDLVGALAGSPAWAAVRIVLHLALLVGAVLVLKGLWGLVRSGTGRGRGLPGLPILAMGLAFLAALGYQASWQLTGLFRPELVAFMQSHDRRQFNPAHRIMRGRILDQRGTVLALSQEQDGQVVRTYPYGPAFAHTVGYIDPRYGATGAEAAANARLNGASPEDLASWGELGRQIVTHDKTPRGQDLALTLDAGLQLLALKDLGERHGAAILLRPADGAVLVLASAPSFDPNRLSPELFRDPDPDTPLLNRATQGLYPPGSTFKTLVAALAIDSGFSGTLDCPADGYTTSSYYPRIRDHDFYIARDAGRSYAGHGRLDLGTAFAESSNVFFAQLGVRLGRDALLAQGERFGFDRQVALHPGGGRSWTMGTGRIPRLSPRDLYGLAQASIGQGRVLTTPIQMASIAAAVANGGLAMRPRLIADDPPAPLGQYMPAATAARLSRMMRRVVTDGTGRSVNDPDLAIAGKTGTAQVPHGAADSWFIGFAPAERPTLAVAVLVEHGGYGSKAAAPIARDLLRAASGLPPQPGPVRTAARAKGPAP